MVEITQIPSWFVDIRASQGGVPGAVQGTDCTAAINNAFSTMTDGETVLIPQGVWDIYDAIACTKNGHIRGFSVNQLTKTFSASGGFDVPNLSPYIAGSILRQNTAAKDVLQLSGSGTSVHLSDFGVKFADAIRHVNTGHGVNATPTQTYSSGHDHGLFHSAWRNVIAFGVDGNHYGFNLINPLWMQLDHLRAYGGGGLAMICDSYAGNYGNSVVTGFYNNLYCNGTSHGLLLQGRATGGQGTMNLVVLVKPNVIVESETGAFPETTPPNLSSQYAINAATNVTHLSVIQPDIEPTANVLSAFPTTVGSGFFMTEDGIYGNKTGGDYIASMPGKGGRQRYSDGTRIGQILGTVVSNGAALGTSPPALVKNAICGDYGGNFTFGSGTSPATGTLARVAFVQTRGTAYNAQVSPGNAATQALGLYVTRDTNGINICCANAPAASQGNTIYEVNYRTNFDG